MQANYGSRWTQQTGTGDALKLSSQVWSEALAGISDKEIIHGLANLPEDFPPTPLKFKSLCQSSGKGLNHNTAAYRRFDKSTAISYDGNKELAKKKLAEARDILNGRQK